MASACNLYWRMHHLQADTITVEPVRGWRRAQVNQSLIAFQWLYYQEQKLESDTDRILHTCTGGEQSLVMASELYFVDRYDPQTCTVYEFHGCLWHGFPHCHPTSRNRKHACNEDRTLNELCRATQVKKNALQMGGYTIVEMWECEWDHRVKTNEDVQAFLKGLDVVPPLNLQDAFFGGRTGAVALLAEVEDGEEIDHVDVTSLYPWVNKTACYPIGHPKIITHPDQRLSSYFRMATLDILPPERLFHPVLPVRSGDKLTFSLP